MRRQEKKTQTAHAIRVLFMERIKGVEPSYAAWEAAVLPMNYIRISFNVAAWPAFAKDKGKQTAKFAQGKAPHSGGQGKQQDNCRLHA